MEKVKKKITIICSSKIVEIVSFFLVLFQCICIFFTWLTLYYVYGFISDFPT